MQSYHSLIVDWGTAAIACWALMLAPNRYFLVIVKRSRYYSYGNTVVL